MKRPLLVGLLAMALVAISWGLWSLLETGSTTEFHVRVLVAFLIVGAALSGAMITVGEPSLAHVSPRLQLGAVAVMVGAVAIFTAWRHPSGADLGDLLMLAVVVGICWRVPASAFESARQPVRRRIRRIRGPHLRIVS